MAATEITDRKAAKAAKRHANTVDAIPPVARLFPQDLAYLISTSRIRKAPVARRPSEE
jgi:hypothetical protein